MIPIAIFVILASVYFLFSMKWGVLRLLSGAFGVAAGLAVFFTGINLGPEFIADLLAFELTWEFILVGAGILGAVAYFFVWAISGFILKFLFNADSPLHRLVDGVPGGILSLFASLVMTFFIYSAIRVSGTFLELNYVSGIAQPSIEQADLDKLPERPKITRWRDQIERLPKVADWLDLCDPFSRRENRNFGIVCLFAATQPARDFSSTSSQMASILSNRKVADWINSEELENQLRLNDQVGMVLEPESQEIASHPELRNRLRKLNVAKHIDEFVQYVKTNKTPNF